MVGGEEGALGEGEGGRLGGGEGEGGGGASRQEAEEAVAGAEVGAGAEGRADSRADAQDGCCARALYEAALIMGDAENSPI